MEQPKRPRGRPPVENKRDKKITIRVTEKEFNKIQNNANHSGCSLTEYIIKKTIDK